MNTRIGAGRALGEGGVSETLGDGGSQEPVVLPRLVSESEEAEEDESGNDAIPTRNLQDNDRERILAVQGPRELEDTRVPPVGVSPGDPRMSPQRSVRSEHPNVQWDGEGEIDTSQSNETPVAAVSQVAVGSDKISELLSPPHERTDGEDWERNGPS